MEIRSIRETLLNLSANPPTVSPEQAIRELARITLVIAEAVEDLQRRAPTEFEPLLKDDKSSVIHACISLAA
jgi:hypothetical protein